jgi:hypothetical protein
MSKPSIKSLLSANNTNRQQIQLSRLCLLQRLETPKNISKRNLQAKLVPITTMTSMRSIRSHPSIESNMPYRPTWRNLHRNKYILRKNIKKHFKFTSSNALFTIWHRCQSLISFKQMENSSPIP